MELIDKIEKAIHMASKLGDYAFDLVEGRELYYLRKEIAEEIKQLKNQPDSWVMPESDSDYD